MTILQIAKEYIPCHKITIYPKDKPWITHEIKKTIKKRNQLYRRYERTRNIHHYEVYSKVKTEVNSRITEAKVQHKSKLVKKLTSLRSNPKNFWNIAKQVYGSTVKKSIPTLIEDGEQYSTTDEKANILAKYFASQSKKPDVPENYITPEIPPDNEANTLQNLTVTEEEVYTVLRKLKTGKAGGPDNLNNELLKMTARSITPSMTLLFNRILSTGIYPDVWKQANISPVFKKGDRQKKKNYRPVSLLSSTGKVLERLVFNKVYDYCKNNDLLTWRNSGYKNMDSTTNRLIYIVNKIYKHMDNKEDTCLVFLDQSKAFDRIHHESLTYKMRRMGIEGTLLNLLNNYLCNRQSRVVMDGSKSKWYHLTAGVPQGSILGPLLFLIYTNDLVDNLECDIHLYADDAVLMTHYKENKEESFQKMNRDLQRLNEWATKWFMSFNPTKTKYMVVTATETPNPDLQLDGINIEKVRSYSQLGLILNEKMNWDAHIDNIISKANKKIGLIWRLSNHVPRFAVEIIYTTYIRPQLEYCVVIYNNCTKETSTRLESCQRRAAIACTRAYQRTNTITLLEELGWDKLETRRTYLCHILMYKLTNALVPEYMTLLLPPMQGQNAGYVSRREKSFIPIRATTERYRRSIIPTAIRNWNNLHTKYRTSSSLASFKHNMKNQLFAKKITYYSQGCGSSSVTHTRMRLGLSPLRQHLFRHYIVDSPMCLLCDENEEESVTHYVMGCPRHTTARDLLLLKMEPTLDLLNININTEISIMKLIINGHPNLSFQQNVNLFNIVHEFITNSKRF